MSVLSGGAVQSPTDKCATCRRTGANVAESVLLRPICVIPHCIL